MEAFCLSYLLPVSLSVAPIYLLAWREVTGKIRITGFIISYSKMEIGLDGSVFGTNNGTTDLIKMSRNLYH